MMDVENICSDMSYLKGQPYCLANVKMIYLIFNLGHRRGDLIKSGIYYKTALPVPVTYE